MLPIYYQYIACQYITLHYPNYQIIHAEVFLKSNNVHNLAMLLPCEVINNEDKHKVKMTKRRVKLTNASPSINQSKQIE